MVQVCPLDVSPILVGRRARRPQRLVRDAAGEAGTGEGPVASCAVLPFAEAAAELDVAVNAPGRNQPEARAPQAGSWGWRCGVV